MSIIVEPVDRVVPGLYLQWLVFVLDLDTDEPTVVTPL
jgi:hypothetical protein